MASSASGLDQTKPGCLRQNSLFGATLKSLSVVQHERNALRSEVVQAILTQRRGFACSPGFSRSFEQTVRHLDRLRPGLQANPRTPAKRPLTASLLANELERIRVEPGFGIRTLQVTDEFHLLV